MSDRFDEPVSPPPMEGAGESSPSVRRGTPETRAPESPIALILVGFFVGMVLGGLLILAGAASDAPFLTFFGYVLVVAGSIITWIGVVAAGVRLGMRWARIDDGGS